MRDRWFANYVAATLARDLVELADIRRLDDAERLLRLLATQSANLLSYRKVGARLDMHHDTVQGYVALLEQMFLVKRLPAWRPGLGAREAATPKLYVCDSGLLAHLLGADAQRIGHDDQVTGKLCETFVVGELLRHASWSEQQPRVYHYHRDREDVDVVLENNRGEVVGVEVKAAATLRATDWKWLKKLADSPREQLQGRRRRSTPASRPFPSANGYGRCRTAGYGPRSSARTSVLSTFPTFERGSSVQTSTCLGAFTLPIRSFTNAISSAASVVAPGLSSTTASTRSPHFSSGRPITAQSRTASCCISACSTSAE